MKILIPITVTLYLCGSCFLFAQESRLKKANTSYDNYAYADAIQKYNQLIASGDATLEVYQKLADCYFFNSNLESAALWYQKMFAEEQRLKDTNSLEDAIGEDYYFRASQALKSIRKYNLADSLLLKGTRIRTNDSRGKRLLDNPGYRAAIDKQSGRYAIHALSRNSIYVDFAPSWYKDQLVFASARGSVKSMAKRSHWTKQPYLDLFYTTVKDSVRMETPEFFSKALNSRFHESTTAFTKDGKTVYVTRNNLIKSKSKKDSTGVSRLKIYRAQLNEKSKWTSIEELPFNQDSYSVAHPTLSADGKKLYFASDMPGGYGLSDLYVVDIYANGKFGTPVNLGPTVNTEGRDTFPFITTSGMLYFASDGHPGLGGLDIFAVNLDEATPKVYNVGRPINSIADDITFIFNEKTRKGYFASNRSGGRGNDDIYSFTETAPLITVCEGILKGIVTDEESGAVLQDALIEVKNDANEVIYTGKTDQKGEFLVQIDCDSKAYTVFTQKEDYTSEEQEIQTSRENPYPTVYCKLKADLPEKGIDLAKLLQLKPIYFASNKALILKKSAEELDKVVSYMKENKSIKIEIGSHTDSKGSDWYNMKLSKRRAKATANYIISKGISETRVQSKGYGETVLINKCGNGVRCSKEEHAKNRRSEFIVIDN